MAISSRKLSHKYLLDFMIRSYRNKGAKDADILHFIAIGELNKEDFETITGKPYPEDANSSAGSNTSDSRGNSSSASSSTGSAGSTASSNASESQSSTANSSDSGATSKDNSSKGSTTTEKSNDSK